MHQKTTAETEAAMNINQISARARIIIDRPPAAVFEAFTDPAIMSRFWFTRRDQGMIEGESLHWYIGDAANATGFEVNIRQLEPPEKIVIEWGQDNAFTRVTWTLEELGAEKTRLTIEETGFTGSEDEVIARALDSTGGFNQVVVAVKALLEHNAAINLIAAHG